MKVLVTGGLGYIGSHTVVELQQAGFEVVVIDNCSNASEKVLKGITAITGSTPAFEKFDLKNKKKVFDFFNRHQDIRGVIHFAASKSVNESIEQPLLYYENNIASLIYLLQAIESNIAFVFSSSCTVYGQASQLPISEDAPIQLAQSPYGNTKQIGEEIIIDQCKANKNFSAVLLRYFNPIGAHPSAMIGELPLGIPQNLVPFITQTAAGIRPELLVFGNDYPTHDGTCIRDYIHVTDLAKAHLVALEHVLNKTQKNNPEIFNLGTGKGSSVLEAISSFEKIAETKLAYRFVNRREGDIAAAYADTEKANKILGWKAQSSLDQAMLTAWNWEKKIRNI